MGEVMVVAGVADVLEGLGDLRTDSKRMRKDLKKIIRTVLAEARKSMSRDARGVLPNDPRRAYQAVRHSVYKRVLGGQVNILQRKRAGGSMSIVRPVRTLRPGQRGGNRRKRSARTNQVDGYVGADRGFILRFINAGTVVRETRYGNRGSIRARNWFDVSSAFAMNTAAGRLEELIGRAVEEVWREDPPRPSL